VIGTIDGSGRVTLVDKQAEPGTPTPVDLNLDQVLGKMPNKTFTFNTSSPVLQPLSLPEGTTAQSALDRVLRLPSVCSKRFLTTKVDRHVTGGSALAVCEALAWRGGVLCAGGGVLVGRALLTVTHALKSAGGRVVSWCVGVSFAELK
jgi:phosphoribosylformylglycinamidine (FGAM) synthase-like enzyme